MRQCRLLLVDDDAVDRRYLGRLLAQPGPDDCLIRQVESGAAGLTALRVSQFDCILLDFNLPDMTGLEFLSAASASNGQLPCAVVLITGQGNEALAVQAMKRGVQDYLVKEQLSADTLWRSVTNAVNQLEMRRRLADSARELTESNVALAAEAAARKAVEGELVTAKELAEQANQAKTRFVAMVTHQLRTPLNGILGYAQLLRIEKGLSARQDSHVGAILHAGQHLLEMIDRVLDFASIGTAQMELHPAEIAVRDLVEGCIASVSPMATARGLNLRAVQGHDAPRNIVADPSRLRQVILGLLSNAVKYTDDGSVELRLLAGATPGGLRVEVADTGRGISQANRERLFQDFERLDTAISVEGTGLGLAITARIVKLMGGTINYAPNPDGPKSSGVNPARGSVFWFDLPPADLAEGYPANHAIVAPRSSGRHVLLVDDIKVNRDVVGAFVKAAGHWVDLVDSGEDAVRQATDKAFDLILMDVRMPGMDGLEATRRIRALPGPHGQVPILALTAYNFPDQVAQCIDAGMNGHVRKPVDYDTLISAIEQAMTGGRQNAAMDGTPQIRETAAAPPRFDRNIFDQTASFLSAEDVAEHLRSLGDRMKQLLRLLDVPDAAAQQADAAHALASAAGAFGFLALCTEARRLEYGLSQMGPDVCDLVEVLRAELRATFFEVDALVRESPLPTA